jgi:hypothetical protein
VLSREGEEEIDEADSEDAEVEQEASDGGEFDVEAFASSDLD